MLLNNRIQRIIKQNALSDSILSLKVAVISIVVVLSLNIVGMLLIENMTFTDAFYTAVITFSTVGFAEVHPFSPAGRIFISFIILLNIIVFAYTISVISSYLMDRKIFKMLHSVLTIQKTKRMKNHTIICGCGNFGREAAKHLISRNCPLVIIDSDESKLRRVNEIAHENAVLPLHKNILDEDVLEKANVASAKTVISAFSDDTNNIYTVLSARQLNPNVTIISRASNMANEKKLYLAGANHIVQPNHICGAFMANLATDQHATISLSNLTHELQTNIEVEEIDFSEFPVHMQNKSLGELKIKENFDISIISFRTADGDYFINPNPDTTIGPRSAIIILGSNEQINKFQKHLNHAK